MTAPESDYADECPQELGQTLDAAVEHGTRAFNEVMASRKTIASLTASLAEKDEQLAAARKQLAAKDEALEKAKRYVHNDHPNTYLRSWTLKEIVAALQTKDAQ